MPAHNVPASPGLAARELAVTLIQAVLHDGRTLDQALRDASAEAPLEDRDRALARRIALAVLRRLGSLEAVLAAFVDRPPHTPRIRAILLAGAAQLLLLGMAAHAVVDLAVQQCRLAASSGRAAGFVNAVLRRVAAEGAGAMATLDIPRIDIPDWLWRRWQSAYGDDTARRIATASLSEAPLDLTVKSDPTAWVARLGAALLPTDSLRLANPGAIDQLPGYAEGAWWAQDAAAALPARLLGDVRGLRVADLCAAPGGKTAQLAAAGARVTAVDLSAERLDRLRSNLDRLKLDADIVTADATAWRPAEPFDAVLLDAPCSSTGTIRRHPDILRLKRPHDIAAACSLQERLLDNAAHCLRRGGLLVYAACSLEPEEGPQQVARFLSRHADFTRRPVDAAGLGGQPGWLTPEGDLRTLPFHLGGMDGFFAACLERSNTLARGGLRR